MPIYAYKCESCGFAKDVLQKMSDAPLSACPQCSALSFKKQLTAAGFQLKGSGWYVTDFRGGNNGAPAAKPAEAQAAASGEASKASPDAGTTTGSAGTPAAAPSAAASPAPSSSGNSPGSGASTKPS
jgi:putative FmdB family regulatory protein